jgi:hypothetical protein
MCRTTTEPHPLYPGLTAPNFGPTECDAAGTLPSCQLCPLSPTYWRNSAPESSAEPWNGTRPNPDTPEPISMEALGEVEASRPVDYSHAIDATTGSKRNPGWYAVSNPRDAKPCTLCARPTIMRSPKHVPCHKVCAEEFNAGRRIFVGPRP